LEGRGLTLDRIALYDLEYEALEALLTSWGEPRFRAEQVWKWLYSSLAGNLEEMTNLPRVLRERLAAETVLSLLGPLAVEESLTGQTRKVLFRLRDGNTLESVLMDYYDRRTACISTQVGCGMGCIFCATGQGGLARNLSAGEIVAQVLYFAREIRAAEIEKADALGLQADLAVHPVTHVVFMGMGEPLANYEATWQAIETLVDERGYNLGARHITLSTVGLVPGIRRLAREGLPITLAVSLHAADDELRNRLVPINRRYPLADLMVAIRDYLDTTHRRVTFEYALIDGVNDAPEQARSLADLLSGILGHVNLIPLNPTPGSPLQPSPREQVDAFRHILEQAGIRTTVRIRRGIDIQAGCGQLRRRQQGGDIAA
jgi:23S rRNA (adenine2503-C2)-methyltransferase